MPVRTRAGHYWRLKNRKSFDAAYSKALAYFQESCHKLFLHEIERRDLLKFSAFLRDEKKQSPRLL
jgi:integrase/recombinase XerD